MVAAASLTLLSSAALSAQTVMAWSYAMRTTTDSGGGRPPISRTITEQVSDRAVRIETARNPKLATASPDAEGEYMLLDTSDSLVTIVRPANHRATISTRQPANDMLRQTHLHYHPGATKQLRDLGPGERILGHATERYQATIHATTDLTILGVTCTRIMNGTTDYWIAPDVDMHAALQEQSTILGLGDLESGTIVTNAPPMTMPKGTALRTVARMTQLNRGTSPDTVTRTTEFLELTHGPVRAARFAVPAGYTTLDVRASMARMSGSLDSAMKAGLAKSLAKTCGGGK